MIVVKLIGGLGNQMFQYAIGRSLSLIHDVPLKLDISAFEDYDDRAYSLKYFKINGEIATALESARFTKAKFLKRSFEKLKPYYRRSIIVECCFDFDANILNAPGDVYLDGYWQSEKYFAEIENIIRKEFAVKTAQEGKNLELAELIASTDSVSLHIRRGDYISDPETKKVHGICNLDYYSSCVEQLTEKLRNPHFFVFSDDPDWARDNLNLSYPMTLVNHNGMDKDYEDLRLMGQCKHHIIANSSFSWWGAWLCENPNKIVIAPERWFNDPNINTNDLIPNTWIRT